MGAAQSQSFPNVDVTKYLPPDLTATNEIGTNKNLYIHYHQWDLPFNQFKCLNISTQKSAWPIPKDLPNILVPRGAYEFVAAIDEVIRQLPVKEPAHPVILATQTVKGDHNYDFKLSALHQKGGEWNFEIRSVLWEEHKEQSLYIPFSVLPDLRQKMVEMRMEYGGIYIQQIDQMPTIPEWATRAASNIEQQEKQPGVKQEQVTEKKADEAENRPCGSNKGIKSDHFHHHEL